MKCDTCKSLGNLSIQTVGRNSGNKVVDYQVCRHKKMLQLFPDGRVVDDDDKPQPDWCPLLPPRDVEWGF